jgi:hypothetical protein
MRELMDTGRDIREDPLVLQKLLRESVVMVDREKRLPR